MRLNCKNEGARGRRTMGGCQLHLRLAKSDRSDRVTLYGWHIAWLLGCHSLRSTLHLGCCVRVAKVAADATCTCRYSAGVFRERPECFRLHALPKRIATVDHGHALGHEIRNKIKIKY